MMTTQDLMDKYEVSRQTVNNWVRKNEIPAPTVKKGHQNAWTFSQAELIDKKLKHSHSEQLELFKTESTPLHINNRRYLGSKQKILDFINHIFQARRIILNKKVYLVFSVDDMTGNIHVELTTLNRSLAEDTLDNLEIGWIEIHDLNVPEKTDWSTKGAPMAAKGLKDTSFQYEIWGIF